MPATVVMPRNAPQTKIAGVAHWGATVRLHGDSFDEARAFATELAAHNGYRLLSAVIQAGCKGAIRISEKV